MNSLESFIRTRLGIRCLSKDTRKLYYETCYEKLWPTNSKSFGIYKHKGARTILHIFDAWISNWSFRSIMPSCICRSNVLEYYCFIRNSYEHVVWVSCIDIHTNGFFTIDEYLWVVLITNEHCVWVLSITLVFGVQ